MTLESKSSIDDNFPTEAETKELAKQINYFRIDKNFTQNPLDGFKEFGELRPLAQSLAYYFYYKLNNNYKDAFGFVIFDPYDFANSLGYSNSYLRTKSKDIIQQRVLSKKSFSEVVKKEEVYESNIENVLYGMQAFGLNLEHNGKLKDGVIYQSITKINIFREFVKLTDPNNPRKKVFGLQFHPDFYNNINTYFSYVIEVELFATLRKHALYDAYLFLNNIREKLTINSQKEAGRFFEEVHYNTLIEIFGIEGEQEKDKKQRLIKKFNKLIEIIDLGIELSWKKNPLGKWAYIPQFNLIPQFKLIVEESSEDRFTAELQSKLYLAFQNTLDIAKQSDIKYFNENSFYAWLRNPKNSWETKKEVYNLTCNNCLKLIPDEKYSFGFITYLKTINFKTFSHKQFIKDINSGNIF